MYFITTNKHVFYLCINKSTRLFDYNIQFNKNIQSDKTKVGEIILWNLFSTFPTIFVIKSGSLSIK